MNKFTIARIASTFEAFVHIEKQIQDFISFNYKVVIITSNIAELKKFSFYSHVEMIEVNFSRNISIINDIYCLLKLISIFKRKNFDIIHSTTPKAGLLSAIAAMISRSKIRFHTFTGQRWACMNGPGRFILMLIDKLIAKINTKIFADSPSQVEFLIQSGIAKRDDLSCVSSGSLGGLDLQKFNIDLFSPNEVKQELKVSGNEITLLYVGRVTEDKGIIDLMNVFNKLRRIDKKVKLLIVGPDEFKNKTIKSYFYEFIKMNAVEYFGNQNDIRKYYVAADILCLPSYREGFGTVVIEAAAMKLPAVASRIPGLVDSIEDGVTGLLFELKNENDFFEKLYHLVLNREFRLEMADNAYKRSVKLYDHKLVSGELNKIYLKHLNIK